jgi:hypothetical protein
MHRIKHNKDNSKYSKHVVDTTTENRHFDDGAKRKKKYGYLEQYYTELLQKKWTVSIFHETQTV